MHVGLCSALLRYKVKSACDINAATLITLQFIVLQKSRCSRSVIHVEKDVFEVSVSLP